MLPKNKKQKGKWLEKRIANDLKKIFNYAFSRADSGSGKYHKEDITLPDNIPLFIECKNQAETKLNEWWNKVLLNCPKNKYPVLIWKQNYERDYKVMMFLDNFLSFIGSREINAFDNIKLIFFWSEFLEILRKKYKNIEN